MAEPQRSLRRQEKPAGQTGQQGQDQPQPQQAQQSLLREDSIPAVILELERLGLLAEPQPQLPHLTAEAKARRVLLTTIRQLKASNILGRGTPTDRSRIILRAEALLADPRGSESSSTAESQRQPDQTRQRRPDHFHPTQYQFGQAQALYEELVEDRPAHQVEPRSLPSVQISKEMDELVIVLAYLGRCGIVTKREAREVLKPRDENWQSAQQTLLTDILQRMHNYENEGARSPDQCRQLLRTGSIIRAYRCLNSFGRASPRAGQSQVALEPNPAGNPRKRWGPQEIKSAEELQAHFVETQVPPQKGRQARQQRGPPPQQRGPAVVTRRQADISRQRQSSPPQQNASRPKHQAPLPHQQSGLTLQQAQSSPQQSRTQDQARAQAPAQVQLAVHAPLSEARRSWMLQAVADCQSLGLISEQQASEILQPDMNVQPMAWRSDMRRRIEAFRSDGGDATAEGRAILERCEEVYAMTGGE